MSRMNLVDKLYSKTVLDKIREMNACFETKNPMVVEFDPTTVCDLACPGCISGELLNQKNSYDRNFSSEKIDEILSDFINLGVKAVILIGGGEPLSHPKAGNIISTLGKNKIQVGITTNGTFIGKYLEEISLYSSWTRVSVDAATEETFKYLRPSLGGLSKFNKVISNMENLAKRKKGLLGFSFLIRTESDGMAPKTAGKDEFGKIEYSNVREIVDAAKLAKEIGCDYFELKPSYDDDHNLIVHNKYDMLIAKEGLEKARELEDDKFQIIESVNLHCALEREQIGSQKKDYNKCPAAQMRTLVTPSGVYVCPYFRGDVEKKIGDLREENLLELWLGEKRKKIMEKLNPQIDCASLHCIRDESNKQVIEIKKQFDSGKSVQEKKIDDLFI